MHSCFSEAAPIVSYLEKGNDRRLAWLGQDFVYSKKQNPQSLRVYSQGGTRDHLHQNLLGC